MTTGCRSVSVCGPVIFTAALCLAATGAEPSAAPAAAPALTTDSPANGTSSSIARLMSGP